MKLIKPSFEIIEQLPGLEGLYKQVEEFCIKQQENVESIAEATKWIRIEAVVEHFIQEETQ